MIFSDIDFFIFLPIALIVYWSAMGQQLKNYLLLILSYFFYANGSPYNLPPILILTLINYTSALSMSNADDEKRKIIFYVTLVLNLSIFILYKTLWEKSLPIGLSFYLLQGIAYITDTYKKTLPPEKNLITYGLYISFFPSLMAGPISKPQDLIPKIKRAKNFSEVDWQSAISEFTLGLFKKAYCADYLAAVITTPVFDHPENYTSTTIAVGIISYTLQIYLDFSGYSSMARGIARMFGVELMMNFNFPLLSNSFVEFWTRWHISLSQWLRDYIYYPLLKLYGKKAGQGAIFAIALITWMVAGFWHGIGVNFILYGAFQGLMVGINTVFKIREGEKLKLLGLRRKPPRFNFLSFLLTFTLFNFSMVIFRTSGLHSLGYLLKNLFLSSGQMNLITSHVIFIFLLCFIENAIGYFNWADKILPKRALLRGCLVGLGLIYIFLVAPKNYVPFIYFQF
jgi:alginate O-acetyltransferase complex protein AlgI